MKRIVDLLPHFRHQYSKAWCLQAIYLWGCFWRHISVFCSLFSVFVAEHYIEDPPPPHSYFETGLPFERLHTLTSRCSILHLWTCARASPSWTFRNEFNNNNNNNNKERDGPVIWSSLSSRDITCQLLPPTVQYPYHVLPYDEFLEVNPCRLHPCWYVSNKTKQKIQLKSHRTREVRFWSLEDAGTPTDFFWMRSWRVPPILFVKKKKKKKKKLAFTWQRRRTHISHVSAEQKRRKTRLSEWGIKGGKSNHQYSIAMLSTCVSRST